MIILRYLISFFAAFCSASFFEFPVAVIFFEFFILTDTFINGLCLGPLLSNNL